MFQIRSRPGKLFRQVFGAPGQWPNLPKRSGAGYDETVLRFSLKDLLLSMSLIALGLGAIVCTISLEPPWKSLGAYGLTLFGAGALAPFSRAWTGAALGCLSYLVLVVVLIVLYGR